MFAKRSLRYVIAASFAMIAVLSDAPMRQASAQRNANVQAQELAEDGARLLIVAKTTLAALPNNPVVARRVLRAIKRWQRDYTTFVSNNPRLDFLNFQIKPTAKESSLAGALYRIADQSGEIGERLSGMLEALGAPTDVEPPQLPWTDPSPFVPKATKYEEMGLDNPGGYVICHGAVPGSVGILRDPSLQVRQSMVKECPHLVGGGGGGGR